MARKAPPEPEVQPAEPGLLQGVHVQTGDPTTREPDEASGQAWTLSVKGPAKGRWRAGRHFGPEVVTIPVADLTADEIEALMGDPELTVLTL